MSEELIKVVNFDGYISHVSDSGEGSEVIIYVAHVISDDSRAHKGKGSSGTQNLLGYAKPTNNNDKDYGDIYTIRVGQCVERVAAKGVSENERLTKVHLIDKGIDVEVERTALFPSTSQTKIETDCMCPVLVVDAGDEQRKVATQIAGRECRCINGNLVVIPSVGLCVKGRLLISYENGGYAELKDISSAPADGQECAKFVMEGIVPQSNGDISPPPVSVRERSSRYSYESNARRRHGNGSGGRYARKNEYTDATGTYGNDAYASADNQTANCWTDSPSNDDSTIVEKSVPVGRGQQYGGFSKFSYGDREETRSDMYTAVPKPHTPYKQRAFKEYIPNKYPRLMRIRFDKYDPPPMDTFWAFDPNIFTTIERILHEGRAHYGTFPQFDESILHELHGVGCIVRAAVDTGCRSLCRAEIIKYAESTHRFSVYLVDYGFYKWIKCSDVFDISTLSKKDKALFMPVALLHCRIDGDDARSRIRVQQLEKGAEYEITIKSRDAEGVFSVRIERVEDNSGAVTNARDSIMPDNSDENGSLQSDVYAPWYSFSSLQYTNETLAKAFERNVGIGETMRDNAMSNTMMGNSMPFSCWPGFCGFGIPCPMVMPIMMPVMPNYAGVAKSNQEDQVSDQFDQGNDVAGDDPMEMNENMHNARNKRDEDSFLGREEREYRSAERNRERPYRGDSGFSGRGDMQARRSDRFDQRNNSRWGGGGERGGSNRGYRSAKRSPRVNLSRADEARGSFSSDSPGFTSSRRENKKRGGPVACTGSSEWDLPPPRNHCANRFNGFDSENTSEMNSK